MTLAALPDWLPLVNNLVVIVGLVISAGIFMLGFKTGQKASKESVEAERRSAEILVKNMEYQALHEKERWTQQMQILMKTIEMEKDRQERDRMTAREQADHQMAIAMEQAQRQMEMLKKTHAQEVQFQQRYFEMMMEKAKSDAQREKVG